MKKFSIDFWADIAKQFRKNYYEAFSEIEYYLVYCPTFPSKCGWIKITNTSKFESYCILNNYPFKKTSKDSLKEDMKLFKTEHKI